MKDRHASNPPDEVEPLKVVLIAEARVGVDLQSVVVNGRILKESKIGVEDLSGQ